MLNECQKVRSCGVFADRKASGGLANTKTNLAIVAAVETANKLVQKRARPGLEGSVGGRVKYIMFQHDKSGGTCVSAIPE